MCFQSLAECGQWLSIRHISRRAFPSMCGNKQPETGTKTKTGT